MQARFYNMVQAAAVEGGLVRRHKPAEWAGGRVAQGEREWRGDKAMND